MPKNKRHKYERVKHLPNVTFSVFGESPAAALLSLVPGVGYEGMQTVLELGCGKGEHSLAFAAADSRKAMCGRRLQEPSHVCRC
jgi:tRNA (guanine-N7-)-methyltransferase